MRFRILNDHINYIALTLAVAGGAIFTSGADLQPNQVMVGNRVADGEVLDPNATEQLITLSSNETFLLRNERQVLGYVPTPKPAPRSSLRVLMVPGAEPADFAVDGYHGVMCMVGDIKTPAFDRTNWVDIWESKNTVRIVIMVAPNGPIYSSTNSGMAWNIVNAPGEYRFPLNVNARGGGLVAAATILPSAENQAIDYPAKTNWYAVVSTPDGGRLVLTKDVSQPAPDLYITSSSGQVVVVWSSWFTNYVLQMNSDLSSTNWVDVTNPVIPVGPENQVVMPPSAGNAFYRLRSP